MEVPDEEQPEQGTAAWFLGLDPFVLTRPPLGPGGLTFHLRLERHRRDEERGYLGHVAGTAGALPGLPHPELGSWQDSRYWFGICERRCRIRVPEDHVASLWVELNPPEDFVGVLDVISAWYGLLAGHTWQYGDNPAAYWDARRGLLS